MGHLLRVGLGADAAQAFPNWVRSVISQGRYFYYPHFTDKKNWGLSVSHSASHR